MKFLRELFGLKMEFFSVVSHFQNFISSLHNPKYISSEARSMWREKNVH